MSEKRKPTRAELWNKLESEARFEALDESLKGVLAMSDDELAAELRKEGVDVDGSSKDAETSAWVSGPPPPLTARPFSRRTLWLVAAAITVSLGAGVPLAAGLMRQHAPDVTDRADGGPRLDDAGRPASTLEAPATGEKALNTPSKK
jgi:hypothetical protein